MHCNSLLCEKHSLICEKHNPLNILNRCFLLSISRTCIKLFKFSFDPSMWKTQPFHLLNRCLSFICFKDLQVKQIKSRYEHFETNQPSSSAPHLPISALTQNHFHQRTVYHSHHKPKAELTWQSGQQSSILGSSSSSFPFWILQPELSGLRSDGHILLHQVRDGGKGGRGARGGGQRLAFAHGSKLQEARLFPNLHLQERIFLKPCAHSAMFCDTSFTAGFHLPASLSCACRVLFCRLFF